MISSNIINELKAHDSLDENDISPNYFFAIKDIEQDNTCNQDNIEFTLYRINKNLNEVIENSLVYKKKLIISGRTEITDDNLIYTKLIGYESNIENNKVEESSIKNSPNIEIIETKLNKELDIDFTELYQGKYENDELKCTSVIINIEKEYESLYKSYSTKFKRDENKNIYGVKIFFNGLKIKKGYPMVRITIIGDLYEENNIDESEGD